MTPAGGARCGARGSWLVTLAPGRLWASCLPALRPACEVLSLDWDRRAWVTPMSRRLVFAPRLERALRIERSCHVPGSLA